MNLNFSCTGELNKRALSIMVVSLLIIAGFSMTAQAGNEGQGSPQIKVAPGHQGIKVEPANFSQETLQKNMSIERRNKKHAEDDQDTIKIDVEGLSKTGRDNSDDKQFGFKGRNNEEEIDIQGEAIKVSINGENYQSLDSKVEVLDRGDDSAELEFKVDEDELFDSWQELPAGKYKGSIDIYPEEVLRGSSPQLSVKIEESTQLDLDGDSLELTIVEPPNDRGESEEIEWEVNSNADYSVTFESDGFEEICDYEIGDFITYYIEDGEANTALNPGKVESVNYNSGSFVVEYDYDSEERDWHELASDTYEDTITVTVNGD